MASYNVIFTSSFWTAATLWRSLGLEIVTVDQGYPVNFQAEQIAEQIFDSNPKSDCSAVSHYILLYLYTLQWLVG